MHKSRWQFDIISERDKVAGYTKAGVRRSTYIEEDGAGGDGGLPSI